MAGKNTVRFRGHESFIIREGWLNKGLWEVSQNPKLFFHNYGADDLGVGPNMAKAIRYWMRCSKLLDETKKTQIELSSLGKLLLEKDPYFENLISLWIVHCNIATNTEQATAWEIFFNTFDYEEFTREEMEKELFTLAMRKADGKKFAEKSLQDDCDAILRMYCKKEVAVTNPEEKNVSPFGALGLLKCSNGVYSKVQPDLNRIPPEIVLYLMCDCVGIGNGINIDELLRMEKGPGKVLNLKRTGLVELLEKLEAAGKITMNRTAGLDMVYLKDTLDKKSVIEDCYK